MIKPFDEADTFASYLYRSRPYSREEHDRAAQEIRELLREYRNHILSDLLNDYRRSSETPSSLEPYGKEQG